MGKSKRTSKARVRKFVIKNPIFPFEVGVWVGPPTIKGLTSFARRAGLLGLSDELQAPHESQLGGGCWELDGGALIWLESVSPKVETLGAILHEATHATLFIGRQIGFLPCNESCEFYTYFSQYLFQQIIERSIK